MKIALLVPVGPADVRETTKKMFPGIEFNEIGNEIYIDIPPDKEADARVEEIRLGNAKSHYEWGKAIAQGACAGWKNV